MRAEEWQRTRQRDTGTSCAHPTPDAAKRNRHPGHAPAHCTQAHRSDHFDLAYFAGLFRAFHEDHGHLIYDYTAMINTIREDREIDLQQVMPGEKSADILRTGDDAFKVAFPAPAS